LALGGIDAPETKCMVDNEQIIIPLPIITWDRL